jgi:DNA repair protein RecN (Recombination protein N)
MLRSLAIRNFVVVAALDVEFGEGFTVLTGETGAGSRSCSTRWACCSAIASKSAAPRRRRARRARRRVRRVRRAAVGAWLAEQELAQRRRRVLLRRVLDAQGKSRAWINGAAGHAGATSDWARARRDPRPACASSRWPDPRRSGS